MQTDLAPLTAVAPRIAPKITACARIVSQTCSIEPDDLEQLAWLKLTERVVADPDFINRPDVELVTFGKWRMQHARSAAASYDRHVYEETIWVDDDGEEQSDFEWIADPGRDSDDPEEIRIRRELEEAVRKALEGLSASNRLIAGMLAAGYQAWEIAREMGISPAAVSQRKRTIAGALASVASAM